jgi:hypothetical protein
MLNKKSSNFVDKGIKNILTFSLDTWGDSIEYVAHRNSCRTRSNAAPPYSLRLELGGFTLAVTPGQPLIPLCINSSAVVLPHCSGDGSAAPSINEPFANERRRISEYMTSHLLWTTITSEPD